MTDRFIETQDLILEIETEDSTLSGHSAKRIYYIPPNADGTPGDIESATYVEGTAVAGAFGNSVNQGAAIALVKGVLVYWSESVNAGGKKCISPAFEILAETRGTVRR